jgi:hypothetical protein
MDDEEFIQLDSDSLELMSDAEVVELYEEKLEGTVQPEDTRAMLEYKIAQLVVDLA